MADHETKRIGPDHAEKVFPLVKEYILEGWQVYGQSGYCRNGCASVDTIEVYLVRPKQAEPGKCLLPETELDGREG